MDIKDFIAGQWKTGYQYKYFSPSLIKLYNAQQLHRLLLEQPVVKIQ